MAKIQILLVEDDHDVAELLTIFFTDMDYEVFHAADGTEGIALARAHLPTLIILDVMLPDIDGWGVAEALREKTLTRYIPIIFLTQRQERSDRLKGLTLGADDYITKPFDPKELQLRVQSVIRRATRERLYEPRTGLPGPPLIQAVLERLGKKKRGVHRLEVHVDGLTTFRDVYGFIAGDDALGYAARALRDAVREHGTQDDFIGLADDDSFVVCTFTRNVKAFQKALHDTFTANVRVLYSFGDAERGYLLLHPGTPREERIPLMQLSVERVN